MAMKKAAPKKSGASDKAKKAQSARMTAHAKAPAKAAAAKTNAARFKPIRQPNGEINEGQLWKANRTYKNTTVPKAIVQMLRDDSAVPYKTRSGKRMITGTYKGAGSKQNKKGK